MSYSVTRFGEISLYQNFNSLWDMFGIVLVFGKLLDLLWQFLCYWANFQLRKGSLVSKSILKKKTNSFIWWSYLSLVALKVFLTIKQLSALIALKCVFISL